MRIRLQGAGVAAPDPVRFSADQLISTPLYTGVHVDDVTIGR